MGDDALERLLKEAQTEPPPPFGGQSRSASWGPDDVLANAVRRDLEALAWIDEQMLDAKRLAERFGLSELLPGIALTRAGITKEVQRLVKSCRGAVPSVQEPTECHVLPFPARAGQ